MLVAANDGAPLSSEGVAALASLRASAKREGRTVGRFGVGFAAVAAVSDEVVVASPSGGVRFSRAGTLAAAREVPALAAELKARSDRVPLLRLPFETDATAPAFEVRVEVRPDAREAVQAALDAVDPTLLLVLPGLTRLVVQGRELRAQADGDDVVVDGVRWRVRTDEGDLDPVLLADRPVEERDQTRWRAVVAVPLEQGLPVALPAGVPAVLRAPTPTDDPLSLPAIVSASLPLGPDRRRVLPGPLTDEVLGRVADLISRLVVELPLDPSRLTLVPGPLAAGEIDAALGRLLLPALRAARVLGDREPVVVEGSGPELVDLLADVLPGVLPHPWAASGWSAPLRALGVRRVSLAELTELLAGLDRPPSWWGRLYTALPPDTDQLGSLPVPLGAGGMAPSPRGLLVSDGPVDLSALGFRVVHPEAVHDLLLRLGAQHAEPRALLEDPRVRAAVEAVEDADPEEMQAVVAAVLDLVGAADLRPGDLPWLSVLPLPTTDGDARPAGELLLPGGPLAAVVDLDAGFGVVAEGVAHPDVLAAVGVLRSFAVVPVEEAEDVDGLDAWLATLTPGQEPGLVVRDLDLVRDDAWPVALQLLAGTLTPYVVWWLRHHPVLDGQRPDHLVRKGSDPLLVGLLHETDHPLAAALGVPRTLAEIAPGLLLERLADPERLLTRDQVRGLHAHLATVDDLPLPDRVRAVLDGRLTVVPAEDAVVVDRPDLLPLVAPYAVLPCPLEHADALAAVLDLALASEVVPTPVVEGGPEHERLTATTAGGEQRDVVWLHVGGVDHVVGPEGQARAQAWREGRWERRHALLALLRGEAEAADTDLDPAAG